MELETGESLCYSVDPRSSITCDPLLQALILVFAQRGCEILARLVSLVCIFAFLGGASRSTNNFDGRPCADAPQFDVCCSDKYASRWPPSWGVLASQHSYNFVKYFSKFQHFEIAQRLY